MLAKYRDGEFSEKCKILKINAFYQKKDNVGH